MDRDQIICKLKAAIEENKVKEFEEQCKEQITQIDTYIKVIYLVKVIEIV